MRVLRELWAKIVAGWARRFGSARTPAALPRPDTLIERIERLDDRDRELLRVAEEAHRRGYPDQACAAYWKAAHHYIADGRHQKALAVLGAILRLRPRDLDAHVARAFALGNLERRHDAALAFSDAAQLFETQGEPKRALEMLELCIDFDPHLPNLEARYVRLGGQRNVWGDPSAPRVDTRDLPARVASAASAIPIESLRVAALSDAEPRSRPSIQPCSVNGEQVRLPNLRAHSRAARAFGPCVSGRAVSTHGLTERHCPSIDPADTTLEEAPLDLDLGPSDEEDVAHGPAQRTPRPPVRFMIPAQETVYEPGPPASMQAEEGETPDVPRSAPLAIVDAETQAFDKEILAHLVERSRGQS